MTRTRAERMSSAGPVAEDRPSRSRRLAAMAAVGVAVVAAPTAHGLHVVNGTFDASSLATTGLLFALLGALVLVRQPGNAVGVVLTIIGVASVLGALSEAVTTVTYGAGLVDVPGAVWAAWLSEWYWVVVIWLQFVAVPLLFPDGRTIGAGWRRFGLVAAVTAGTCGLLAAGGRELVLEGIQLGVDATSDAVVVLDNPLGVLPLGNFERDLELLVLLLPVFAVGAAGSLVQRFRRSTGDLRHQLKVAVTGILVAVVGFATFAMLDAATAPVIGALELPLLLLIPVSFGVAILRYRLYDVDRLVSRTVAWTLVSAMLVGLYLGGVVLLQAVLRPLVGEGDLPVALATLAAAAVARPLLHRVQALVDRRFNRAHYDAARTIEAFGRALRDEVSREAVVEGLRGTAAQTFRPASVGVTIVSAEAGVRP